MKKNNHSISLTSLILLLLTGSVVVPVILLLADPAPKADWCKVVMPAAGSPGSKYILEVEYFTTRSCFLTVDLHYKGVNKEPKGFLSHAEPVKILPGTGSASFVLSVPVLEGYVFGVIFLSSSGAWSDREKGAYTRDIPVRPAPSGDSRFFRGRAYLMSTNAYGEPDFNLPEGFPAAMGLRILVALAYGGTGFFAFLKRREGGSSGKPWRLFIGVYMFLLSFLAATGLWYRLTVFLRSFAREGGWYYLRGGFQQGLLFGLVILAVLSAVVFAVKKMRQKKHSAFLYTTPAFWGCLLVGSLMFLQIISFHYVDQLNFQILPGVYFFRLLELFGIALVAGWLIKEQAAARTQEKP